MLTTRTFACTLTILLLALLVPGSSLSKDRIVDLLIQKGIITREEAEESEREAEEKMRATIGYNKFNSSLYIRMPHESARFADNDIGLGVKNYPSVDGSTSTQPLETFIACHLLGSDCAWLVQPTGPTGESKLMAVVKSSPGMGTEEHRDRVTLANYVNWKARHSGTHPAYENLINRRARLILVARKPSEDELKLAREKDIKLDARPVALDAFVFITNKKNNVESLTEEQIKSIYTARTTDWGDVGGAEGREIKAYQRNPNSGSQELMEKLVMKELKIVDAPDLIAYGMGGPFDRLEGDENGLAYSVFFYEQRMQLSRSTRLIGVDGVTPDKNTIRERKYPYVAEIYCVIRDGTEEHDQARKLRDWLLTEEGQKAIEESGYVPLGKAEREE